MRQLRTMTQVPVCVGFGISKAEHIKQFAGVADGAIVGSAFVKKISECKQGGLGGDWRPAWVTIAGNCWAARD